MRHTLFDIGFVKQFPHPKFSATESTRVLDHEVPTWQSLRGLVDARWGMGALSQGALGAGFAPAVSVENAFMVMQMMQPYKPYVSNMLGMPKPCQLASIAG